MTYSANIVYQTSTTTGTGNLSLTSVTGYRAYSAAFPSSSVSSRFYYAIRHQTANEYEIGEGYLSGSALVRHTVIQSSNSNNLVNFSAGTKDVLNDVPASLQEQLVTLTADLAGKANTSHSHAISDVTGLQTALDGKVDENASITGATKTKITYDAKGLVTGGADATTADISDSSNRRYVTDAQLTVIGNTSGTNTGDQTITLTGDVTGSGTGSFVTAIGSGVIVNADVNASAAIARSKLASGTASHVVTNDASGVLSSEAQLSSQRGGFGLDMSDVQVVSTGGSLGAITPTAGIIKFTNSTAAVNGFTAPTSDTYSTLFIINDSGSNILLVHEQGAITATARIHMIGNVQFSMPNNYMVAMVYDFNDSRWKCSAIQPIGTANYATYWDSQGRLASEQRLAISRGGTNNGSFTDGSVPYYDGTKLAEDNSNLYYNDVTKAFGVGVGTSPDAGVNAMATPGPGVPSSPSASINYAGSGYSAGSSATHDYRFYGKSGSVFSSTYVSPSTVNENLTPTSVSAGADISGGGFAYSQGGISYRSYPLFNSDTSRGAYAASSFSGWANTGGDNGSVSSNVGSGSYTSGDSIEYRFYPLFEGDTSWHPDPVAFATISEGGGNFDVDVKWSYTGTGSPSNFVIERNVNGGGWNDYRVQGGDFTDTNSGWSGGPPSYSNLDYNINISGTNPTGISPSSIRHFRDTGSGFNEYKDGGFTFTDDNTGWTAGSEGADLPAVQTYSISLSCAAGSGADDVRWTKSDSAGHSYTSHYDDFGSATSGTDDNTMTSGNVLTPNSGYAFHGEGGASLFEPGTETVQIDKSNAGTNVATNSITQAHLALTNSNGSPITGITFKHGSNVRGVFQVDAGNAMNFQSDNNLRFHTNLTTSNSPTVNIGVSGAFFGQAVVSPSARLHTRTNGSLDHLRIENSSGTVIGKIEADADMVLGGTSATTNNGSVDRILKLENTNGTNTVLHLTSNTTVQHQGGVLEVSGGKTGADARIGQWNVRYLNGTISDSTGQILMQINNDSASLVDAWLTNGHSSLNALTRFGSSTTPTAVVHVRAGSSAAASFCLDAQAAPTTPVSGDIWHDTTQKTLMAYTAGIKQASSGVLATQTSSVTVANTVTETTLIGTVVGTMTLPANFFVAGKTIRLMLRGLHSSTANPNITIRLKFGSTTIASTGAVASNNGSTDGWQALIDCTCRTTGASATVMANGNYIELQNTGGTAAIKDSGATFDSTASQTVSVTVEWGTASASNTITCQTMIMEVLN